MSHVFPGISAEQLVDKIASLFPGGKYTGNACLEFTEDKVTVGVRFFGKFEHIFFDITYGNFNDLLLSYNPPKIIIANAEM